jgi:hypothetical protein
MQSRRMRGLAVLSAMLFVCCGGAQAATILLDLPIPLQLGTGDEVHVFTPAVPTRLRIASGTGTAPDRLAQPLIKFERTQQLLLTDPGIVGDGSAQAAVLAVVVTGTLANQVQPLAIYGGAVTNGPYNSTAGYFHARNLYATGSANALFALARTDTSAVTGGALGFELDTENESGVRTAYDPTGFNRVTNLWLNVLGAAGGNAAILLANGFNSPGKWQVGIGFQAMNGGPVQESSLRDNGQAAISLDVRGSHTTALAVAAGAGNVVLVPLKADAGERYACITTTGELVAHGWPCSGY